jgi:hypothetical protein
MTAEWDLLKGQADARARERLRKKDKAVAEDAEPQISMDLWNEANTKHRKLMTLLMTFPGIVVVTARGKEVAALDAAGRPIEGSKEYRVEGQKNLAFDAAVWIRVSRDHHPMVVGARSVHAGIRPGVDKPRPVPGLTLEKVVFDVLRCNPAEAQVRDLTELQTSKPEAEEPMPAAEESVAAPQNGRPTPQQTGTCEQFLERIKKAETPEAIANLGQLVGDARGAGQVTKAQYDRLSKAAAHRLGQLEQQKVPA